MTFDRLFLKFTQKLLLHLGKFAPIFLFLRLYFRFGDMTDGWRDRQTGRTGKTCNAVYWDGCIIKLSFSE